MLELAKGKGAGQKAKCDRSLIEPLLNRSDPAIHDCPLARGQGRKITDLKPGVARVGRRCFMWHQRNVGDGDIPITRMALPIAECADLLQPGRSLTQSIACGASC